MIRGIDTGHGNSYTGEAPTIPGCEFIRYVGEGSSGVVYQARVGRRLVAVKVFWEGAFPNTDLLERFMKGRRDRIRHPNLQPVLQLGQTTTGELFYCTPFLSGDPLREILNGLQEGRCSTPSLAALALGPHGEICARRTGAAVEIFADVAEGLGVAHQAGVSHRRVHAGNLVFSPTGRLVLTDFGVDSRVAKDTTEDVAALGTILRTILSHQRSEESPEASEDETRHGAARRHGDDALSTAHLPPSLESCLLKATAARPADRYRNGNEFSLDLRRFLNHDRPHALGVVVPARRAARRSTEKDAWPEAVKPTAESTSVRFLSDDSRASSAPPESAVAAPSGAPYVASQSAVSINVPAESSRSKPTAKAQRTPKRSIEHRRTTVVAHVVAAVLVFALSLVVWLAIESTTREVKLQQDEQVRQAVSEERFDDALAFATALNEFDRGDPVGNALTDFVKNSAVNDALAAAVDALSKERFGAAAETIRDAAPFVDRPESFTSIAHRIDELERLNTRDPVVAGLESKSIVERRIALDRLEAEIDAADRSTADATLAIRALDPKRPELFDRGIEVLTLAGDSEPLLDALGVGSGEPSVVMNDSLFATFHDALVTIGDDAANALLCSWTYEIRELLNRAQLGALVHLAPNLVIHVDRNESGERIDYVTRWIDWIVTHEPEELLRAVPKVAQDFDRLAQLVDALSASGAPKAPAVITHLVRESPFTVGHLGIRALAQLAAVDSLLELAQGFFPIELRLAALRQIRDNFAEVGIPQLKTMALTSPEPRVRKAALDCLALSHDPVAISALPGAVYDYALERAALRWLEQLQPSACVEECIALLRHNKGHIRRVAYEKLAQVEGSKLLLPVTRHLLDPDPGIRAAALSLLKRKTEAWTRILNLNATSKNVKTPSLDFTLGERLLAGITTHGVPSRWLFTLLLGEWINPKSNPTFGAFAGARQAFADTLIAWRGRLQQTQDANK